MATNIVAVGDVYALQIHTHAEDQEGINTHHLRVTAITGVPSQGDLANVLSNAMSLVYPPLMYSGARYEGVKLQRILPSKQRAETSISDATAGVAGDQPLPRQVAGLGTKLTNGVGRRSRGRLYSPFPAVADQSATEDKPTAGYAGRLADLLTAVTGTETVSLTGLGNTVTFEYGLLSKLGVFTPTDDWRANHKWATQRRRGDYGRPNPTFP